MNAFVSAGYCFNSAVQMLHRNSLDGRLGLRQQGAYVTVHPEQNYFLSAPYEADAGQSHIPRKSMRLVLYAELVAVDLFALVAGPLLAMWALVMMGSPPADFFPSAAVTVVYLVNGTARGAYSRQAISNAIDAVRSGVISLLTAVFIVLMVAFFLKSGEDISRLNFAAAAVISGFLLVAGRALFPRHARRVCGGQLMNELIIVHGKQSFVPRQGAVVLNADRANLKPDLNDPSMLDEFGTIVQSFDRVLVDCPPEHRRAWALMLKGANVQGEIFVEQANEMGAIAMGSFHGQDTLLVSRQPLSLPHRLQKRVLDLAVTVPLIILLAPMLVLVAIAIKLDTPGPVFFRQLRVGRGNRMFKVLKFRSMRIDSCDANGTRSTARQDDRITRVGQFIRATSIDELPQLLNVLLGDMSLVGPRPHALGSLAGNQLFWRIDETYWLRHQLKPGITGLAQMRGHRGATVHVSDLVNRLQSDMEYIQDWNIWRDIAILVGTVRVVVHNNAY